MTLAAMLLLRLGQEKSESNRELIGLLSAQLLPIWVDFLAFLDTTVTLRRSWKNAQFWPKTKVALL